MELKTGTIDVGTFNKMYVAGNIYPYKNNRGGRIFDKNRVNKYAAAWDNASSGCAVLEKTKDGYMLRDFHNRAEAIKRGVAAGKIGEKETILIRVIPPGDGLSAYKNINSAKHHTGREKLTNPDLAFGREIEKVLAITNVFSDGGMPTKFYQQLAYAIVDTKVRKRSEYVFAATAAAKIREYKDASAKDSNEMELTPAQAKQIAAGINYWGAIRDQVESIAAQTTSGDVPESAKLTLASSQFFGLVVFDYMFHRKLADPSIVGTNVMKNQRRVRDLARSLSTGAADDRLQTSKTLIEVLSKK